MERPKIWHGWAVLDMYSERNGFESLISWQDFCWILQFGTVPKVGHDLLPSEMFAIYCSLLIPCLNLLSKLSECFVVSDDLKIPDKCYWCFDYTCSLFPVTLGFLSSVRWICMCLQVYEFTCVFSRMNLLESSSKWIFLCLQPDESSFVFSQMNLRVSSARLICICLHPN